MGKGYFIQHFVAETPAGKVVDATGAIDWEEFEEDYMDAFSDDGYFVVDFSNANRDQLDAEDLPVQNMEAATDYARAVLGKAGLIGS